MMTLKKVIKPAALILAASFLGTANAAQNYQGVTIERVGCNTDSSACSLYLDQGVNAASCTGSATRVNFDAGTSGGKNTLASALTIKAAGFKANLTIDDVSCAGTNPKLLAITAAD